MKTLTAGGFLVGCSLMLMSGAGTAQAAGPAIEGYRTPPEADVRAIDAFEKIRVPIASASPGGRWVLLQHFRGRPSIAELAQPVLGLAGWKVNPDTNRARLDGFRYVQGFTLIDAHTGEESSLSVPPGEIGAAEWSPDGQRFMFMRSAAGRTELWHIDARTGKAHAIPGLPLNAARSPDTPPCAWAHDGRSVFCLTIPERRPATPALSLVISPRIQDSRPGMTASSLLRTEDRLQSESDERLYDYYMTAQPVEVDLTTETVDAIAGPAIYDSFQPSPDGNYILSIRIVRPYSYLAWDRKFPKSVDILRRNGQRVRTIADVPQDTSGNELLGWASIGPREFFWRPDEPATLGWYQAQDTGNPRREAAVRDRLLLLPAPFTGPPIKLFQSAGRMGSGFARTIWGDGFVVVAESNWDTQVRCLWKIDTSRPQHGAELLWKSTFEHKSNGAYGSSGDLVTALGPKTGRESRREELSNDARLLQDGDWVFLRGEGASPEGGRPFLDRYNLRTRATERIFESKPGTHEEVISILEVASRRLLTTRQTAAVPPNLRILEGDGASRDLTGITDPLAGLRPRDERVDYQRSDGIRLTGQLYLPQEHKSGQRLPVILHVYPVSFSSAEAVLQYYDVPSNIFPNLSLITTMLAGRGYASFYAGMPVVGGPEAYDTLNEQLADNVRAAIDKLVEIGVADRHKIGVTGGSWGGFTTANLLAHTDLFAAGVAERGLYNLTLTPFGVQEERRSYWQAPDTYNRISPFQHAHRIKAPLLLIHGERDNSAGASVIQSTRMFEALYGLGASARLVVLPYETHAIVARESMLHEYWEMLTWFDRYLKSSRSQASAP